MMNLLESEIAEIVLKNCPAGVIGFDNELNCTCWNPAMEVITGYNCHETIGRKIEEILPYLQKTGEINFYKRTLHGEAGNAENQIFFIPENGKHGCYSARYNPIFNDLEEIQGGVVILQDTGKIVSAQQAHKMAEENYLNLINHSPLPVILFTEEEILFANPKTIELLKLEDQSEMTGKSPLFFVAEHDKAAARENIFQIINNQIKEPVVHTLLRKDGTQFDAEISYITTKYNGKTAIQVVIRDITLKIKAFQELLAHKQMLHEAQAIAKMGSYQLSLNNSTAFWTDGVYRIFEVQPAQINPSLGTYLTFVDRQGQEELMALVERLKNKEINEASLIHKIFLASGKEKSIKIIGKPKLDESGEVVSIVGTIQDITELRIVEDELFRANQILNLQFENSPLATIQLDSNLFITSWSKQAEKLFGWTAPEVTGKHITSWNFFESEFGIHLEFLFNTSRINFFNYKKVDLKLFTKNNTTVFCDMFMSGICEENDKLHSILILLNDVTSRQINEQSKQDVQLEERKRVAREIHDGIGQMLIAIKYKLTSLEEFIPEQFQYKLHTIEGMLEQTLEEVRSVSRNLGPRSVATMGLETSLRQMCDQIKKMTAIDLSFRYIGSGVEVNNKIVNALYRIAQEATNNIIKHAMATVASIQVFQGRNFIELKVEDNGVGIEEKESNGMGMKNMEERAKLLGGRFQIHSEAGIGTNIIVNIPIEQN